MALNQLVSLTTSNVIDVEIVVKLAEIKEMITNLMRVFSKKLQEKLQNQKANANIRNIKIFEIDNVYVSYMLYKNQQEEERDQQTLGSAVTTGVAPTIIGNKQP